MKQPTPQSQSESSEGIWSLGVKEIRIISKSLGRQDFSISKEKLHNHLKSSEP